MHSRNLHAKNALRLRSLFPYKMFSIFQRDFPALEELNDTISPEQLRVLKDQMESEKPPTAQSSFNYAWGLLKTDDLRSQRMALEILSTLYRDVPELRRDSLYYLALGSVKIGEYANARRYSDSLLEKEPQNVQFQALKDAVDGSITQDGLIGIGVAGGILALGIGVIGALSRKRR